MCLYLRVCFILRGGKYPREGVGHWGGGVGGGRGMGGVPGLAAVAGLTCTGEAPHDVHPTRRGRPLGRLGAGHGAGLVNSAPPVPPALGSPLAVECPPALDSPHLHSSCTGREGGREGGREEGREGGGETPGEVGCLLVLQLSDGLCVLGHSLQLLSQQGNKVVP